MQKKLIIKNDDLKDTAILPLKDLNNLVNQIEIITRMSQTLKAQFEAMGIDGYSWSNPKCLSLKDYSVNDRDELIVQSKSNAE